MLALTNFLQASLPEATATQKQALASAAKKQKREVAVTAHVQPKQPRLQAPTKKGGVGKKQLKTQEGGVGKKGGKKSGKPGAKTQAGGKGSDAPKAVRRPAAPDSSDAPGAAGAAPKPRRAVLSKPGNAHHQKQLESLNMTTLAL